MELTFDALPGRVFQGKIARISAHEHYREGQHQLHRDRGDARSRSEFAVGDDGIREYSGDEVDERRKTKGLILQRRIIEVE